MPNARMIKSVISEYGPGWLANRTLYSGKLKLMRTAPQTEKWFEKKTTYPRRIDLFDIDMATLKSFLRERLDDEDKKRLIEIADKAADGIITGFSSIELNYGNPIDWQLSPLTGKRCDETQKWYRIPDFDKERGDIKIIWEASRFSHFITLSRAYLLTDNQEYYKTFSNQLKSWLDKNPYSYGANFKCGQECSLRMVNGLLAFTVFRRAGIATDADASNVKDLIDRCYRKILSNFFYAYKCIKNNHTISELMGMIIGSWCAGDEKQLDKAYKLLNEVVDEQFTQDGGYRQFSFNYQRLALQDLEVVMSIKTGREISDRCKYKIKNSAWLMYQCQDESGDIPNYGSNDGALVFPVSSCGYRDFKSVINASYALTTGDQIYEEGKHQEELIWFSGGKKLDVYQIKRVERAPSRFADAGLFTIRGGKSWLMLVSNDFASRPGHMDQNHIDLWVDGVNVLCDAGTYSYASEDGRKLVRNESHNTAVIDNKPQMNSSGPFMIIDWTKRELDRCEVSLIESKITSINGYKHTRLVKQVGGSYEISDTCDKDYQVLFHTPCQVNKCNGGFQLEHDGKVLCIIRSSGEIKVQKSMRSLYYLKKQDTNCLSIRGQAEEEISTVFDFLEGENENG